MPEVNIPNNAGHMGLYEYIDLQGDKPLRVTRIILSILICFCMASVFPITAFAADTGKAIQLGTGGISDSTEVIDNNKSVSYIYFGVNSGNSNTPIKWRVLDADKANDGTTSCFSCLCGNWRTM